MNYLSDTAPRCVRDGKCAMKHGNDALTITDSILHVDSIGGLQLEGHQSAFTFSCCRADCKTRETNVSRALRLYHSCHYCHAYYCTRECRLMDWARHKTVCAHARTESVCKTILRKLLVATAQQDGVKLYQQLSQCAREGFRGMGRGYVLLRIEHFYSLEDVWNGLANVKVEYISLARNNNGVSCCKSNQYGGTGIVKLFEEQLHAHCLDYGTLREFIVRILLPVRGVQFYQPKSRRQYIDKFMVLTLTSTSSSLSATSSSLSSTACNKLHLSSPSEALNQQNERASSSSTSSVSKSSIASRKEPSENLLKPFSRHLSPSTTAQIFHFNNQTYI